jgi:hypothetical protein
VVDGRSVVGARRSWAFSGAHSALSVGFERAKMTGRGLSFVVASTTSLANAPPSALTQTTRTFFSGQVDSGCLTLPRCAMDL